MLDGGELIMGSGFNREFYLGRFYELEGVTSAQLAQIEAGDFSPMTQQLEVLPEGRERDKILFGMEGNVTELEKKVDAALDVAIEHNDMPAIKALHAIIKTLDLLIDKLRSFCSGL